jgi:hypothetical protein
LGLRRQERLQIPAGAEGPARPGDDADRQVVAFIEFFKRLGDADRYRVVDGVPRVWPVHGHNRDPVGVLDQNFTCHKGLLLST